MLTLGPWTYSLVGVVQNCISVNRRSYPVGYTYCTGTPKPPLLSPVPLKILRQNSEPIYRFKNICFRNLEAHRPYLRSLASRVVHFVVQIFRGCLQGIKYSSLW